MGIAQVLSDLLKAASPECREYVVSLQAENLRLVMRCSKLEAELAKSDKVAGEAKRAKPNGRNASLGHQELQLAKRLTSEGSW